MDVPPHPLVVRLVQQVLKRRLASFGVEAKQAIATKLIAAPGGNVEAAIAAAPAQADVAALEAAISTILDKKPVDLSDDERKRLGDAAELADLPDLVTLTGILGGQVDVTMSGRSVKWQILYLDSQLQNWRLIRDEDIILHKRVADDDAPFERRDVIWVNAEAPTARSEAPPRPEVQAQFLRGDFTRAGDLTPSATGAPPTAATGVFCDVVTARCCTRTVRP